MKKKAQVLMIFLWILAILTLLAVGLGYRVSLSSRVIGYQRDRVRGAYLAEGVMNTAIVKLDKDTNDYDALSASWAQAQETPESNCTIIDEERKIDINGIAKEYLLALLEKLEIPEAEDLTNNILAWRGDSSPAIPAESKDYDELGYICKGAKFSNIEELMLVKGMNSEIYQKIIPLVTVFSPGNVNINTVSQDVLDILLRGAAKRVGVTESYADSLAEKIITSRNSSVFTATSDIHNMVFPLLGDEEKNIFTAFESRLIIKSDNFLIEVSANAGKINNRLTVIYNRSGKKIVYWHGQ